MLRPEGNRLKNPDSNRVRVIGRLRPEVGLAQARAAVEAVPPTRAAVAVFLTAVALMACCFPARRATPVDPMVALKVRMEVFSREMFEGES